jgi:hypothetical protein
MKQITYLVGRCHANETGAEEKKREAVEERGEMAVEDGDESKGGGDLKLGRKGMRKPGSCDVSQSSSGVKSERIR